MKRRPLPARRTAIFAGMLTVLAALSLFSLGAVDATPMRDEPAAVDPSCTGTNSTWASLGYNTPIQRDISISCAPAGSTVTKVDVSVDLDHDCTHELNVRLDHAGRSKFLQEKNCSGYPNGNHLQFTSSEYNGLAANGTWSLTLRDACPECPGYFNEWTITVYYRTPTVTPTPTASRTPTPTATSTEGPPIDTPTPTATSTEGPPDRTPSPTATSTEEPPQITPTPTLTGPAVVFPGGDWPQYAQEEISVYPEPPLAGRITRLCAQVVNNDLANWHTATLEFRVADFGICLTWAPVGSVTVQVAPGSSVEGCIAWVPPSDGPWCIEVVLMQEGADPQYSQRNIDQDEPLQAGQSHSLIVPVGNPLDHTVDISLEMVTHLQNWGAELSRDTLRAMTPGQVREVTLTVTPPQGEPLPEDGTVIVDVEAYAEGELIGGFRKVFRPPVPLHRLPDPTYAEREITVSPYPVRTGWPTEICVELCNPTAQFQTVEVQFYWADFGIGIPFTPINGPRTVNLPPHSIVKECIWWVPPSDGNVRFQVELRQDGYAPQYSQHNYDADEPLQPGEPHSKSFPVSNPLDQTVDIDLALIPLVDNWGFALSDDALEDMAPRETRTVSLDVTPPDGQSLPPEGTDIVDVVARVGEELIGGFRKVFQPPVNLHQLPDPVYAEGEITIHPYPLRAGEPTEICVELRNPTALPQDVTVLFSWASFGIGLPFTPINGPRAVHLPPFSIVHECLHWIPPFDGNVCIQVELLAEGYEPQVSRRNIDADEPLQPGESHSVTFPVSNPLDREVDITLGLIPHLPNWGLELNHDVLRDMAPGEAREVTLTVTPPAGEPLPPDETLVVDVEAYVEGELIGGFRKTFRPRIPLHRLPDPSYAEREISVHPYPVLAGQPTEVCVELRNPTAYPQMVTVQFSWANFGIGIPFMPINGPRAVHLPPYSIVKECIYWIPPVTGHVCIQVEVESDGYAPQRSQHNIDVEEPLQPGESHSLTFQVGNPLDHAVDITLGLIPHLPNWGLELSRDTLLDVAPGERRELTLTVTPPLDEPLPADETLIVDVEAFANGVLIGGFRKTFRPPISVHRPKDPVYAESEIGVDPYPIVEGQPVKLSVELFNPTHADQIVAAHFSVAAFGIGLPFSSANISPNPIQIFVPRHGAARGHVMWYPPPGMKGKFCVQVKLEAEGQQVVWSQRNVDVGEPLQPGVPHTLEFAVGTGPTGERLSPNFAAGNEVSVEPMTIMLGLVNHLSGWEVSLSDYLLTDVTSAEPITVSLTVTAPVGSQPGPGEAIVDGETQLGTGRPIVDVEAYTIDGRFLGGFRKLDVPPVSVHKPHEKSYAESEISVDPDPPEVGKETRVSAVLQNTSDVPVEVSVEFGWADLGMGMPFSGAGMVPREQLVTLPPASVTIVDTVWTPTQSGHQCILVRLTDPQGQVRPQESQRNVDVQELPPCGEEKVFTFTIYNDSASTVTVDIGMITFNVPSDWQVTTEPGGSVEIGPHGELEVNVIVWIPCPPDPPPPPTPPEAGAGPPIIDVEGYKGGRFVGGIEIRFPIEEPGFIVNLPMVVKRH